MNTIFYFLFLSFLMIGQVLGQSDQHRTSAATLPQEKIEIKTDRALYITGENIWFSIIAIDKATSQISTHSKVGYIELIAPDGTIITRVKTELISGRSAGSIMLPKALSSNIYKLRAYTRAMRNFSVSAFGSKPIYILNSNQSLVSDGAPDLTVSIDSTHQDSDIHDLEIELDIPKPRIHQRELVELKIKTLDKAGNGERSTVSVSVSIQSPTISSVDSNQTIHDTSDSKEFYLPESIAMKLIGQVLDAFSDPAAENIRVYLSFPGKTAMVYTALTDSEGRFDFLLPRLYGQRQVVLQLDPKVEANHSITLDEEFHSSPDTEAQPFVLPVALVATANRTLANAQITNSYKPFETSPNYLINDKFASLPFYGKAYKIYKLDDYTRFPLPEFFFEVVPEVSVRGKFGNNHLRIFNDYNIANRELIPLLLVDGVPVFEHGDFLNINSKLIVSAEIVKAPYWLNTILHNGIIHIHSIDGDARSFTLPESALRTNFLTFLPERQFTATDYSTELQEKLPDFRNTLYWNPNITTDENGEASIFFYSSDAIGEYEVTVEAINDLGQKGRGAATIEVLKVVN